MRLFELITMLGVLWDSDVFLYSKPSEFLINGKDAINECQMLNIGDEIRFGYKKQFYWIIGKSEEDNIITSR